MMAVRKDGDVLASRPVWTRKGARQVGILYVSLFASMAVGIAVSVFNARVLGAASYGDLKFLQTVFTVVVTCLTFGVFVSGSRLLAQDRYEGHEAGLIGGLVAMCGAIAALMIIVVNLLALAEDGALRGGLGHVIRLCSPLTFVLPLQLCIDNVLQGTNRIYKLSVLRVAPQLLYLVTAVTLSYVLQLRLLEVLLLHLATSGVVVVALTVVLKPTFGAVRQWVAVIRDETRRYGIHVYVGFLTGVATSHLGVLVVNYFMGSEEVAYFALAVTLTLPLMLMPNAIGTSFFRAFARQRSIPRKLTVVTWVVSGLILVGFVAVIGSVVDVLYSAEYRPTTRLTYLIAVGSVCHGLGDFYNRFVGAHGGGKEIRNSNFAVGTVNVVGNVLLVQLLGAAGAAVTKILAGLAHLAMMFRAYRRIAFPSDARC